MYIFAIGIAVRKEASSPVKPMNVAFTALQKLFLWNNMNFRNDMQQCKHILAATENILLKSCCTQS